jgi:hypothetical protein
MRSIEHDRARHDAPHATQPSPTGSLPRRTLKTIRVTTSCADDPTDTDESTDTDLRSN